MNRNILFDASTPFQLMIACVVSEIYYKNDESILCMPNTVLNSISPDSSVGLKERIEKSRFFKKIYIVDVGQSNLKIKTQMDELISLYSIDIYHFSSYGSYHSCYLYNQLVAKIPIVLNEEGGATFYLFKSYEEFKSEMPHSIADHVDLHRLSKIFVVGKKAYFSDRKELVKDIKLGKIEDKKTFLERLNCVYGYRDKRIAHDNIFFTQNFTDYTFASKGKYFSFIKQLHDMFGDNIAFRVHPFDKHFRDYKKMGINLLKDPNMTPWEIVVLNGILNNTLKNKTLLTVSSSSLFSSFRFAKAFGYEENLDYIILNKLFPSPFDKRVDKFHKIFKKEYGFNYAQPKSLEELKALSDHYSNL